jgi:AAA15 family ATPase/GTPase
VELKKVHIKNFRSIEDAIINFEKLDCRILIGENDCGKSNILHALSLLTIDKEIEQTDIRKEVNIVCCEIAFYFSWKYKNDFQQLVQSVMQKRHQVHYVNDVISNEILNMMLRSGDIVKYYKNSNHSNQAYFEVSGHKFYNGKSTIQTEVFSYFSGLLYSVINWEYSKEFEFPTSFTATDLQNIASRADDDVLKNMLSYDDSLYDELIKRINERDDLLIESVLEKISSKLTNHFKKLWLNDKVIFRFKLSFFTVETINIQIAHSVKTSSYSLSLNHGSDGFKKFFSILWQILQSGRKKVLLIIDEPENHLHIKLCEQLRHLLIEISKNQQLNIKIIYATHSPYMVSHDQQSRHLIVKKINGVSKVDDMGLSDHYKSGYKIFDYAPIFSALGYSNFIENFTIRVKNIIFEGNTDLTLYKLYESIYTSTISNTTIGWLYSSGAGKLTTLVMIIEQISADSINYVVLDSDSAGLEAEKQFKERQENGFINKKSNCHTYYELSNKKCRICEDYFQNQLIIDSIDKIKDDLKTYNLDCQDLQSINFIDKSDEESKLDYLLNQLIPKTNKKNIKDKDKKDIKEKIKSELWAKIYDCDANRADFENLIDIDLYKSFIDQLGSKVE